MLLAEPVEQPGRGLWVARMSSDGFVEQRGLHERLRAAATVDGVRVVGGVADHEQPGRERTVGVDEVAQAVAQLAHHEDGRLPCR